MSHYIYIECNMQQESAPVNNLHFASSFSFAAAFLLSFAPCAKVDGLRERWNHLCAHSHKQNINMQSLYYI